MEASIPLSLAQQGIWLGQQKYPETAIYNTGEYLELKGVDESILKQSILTCLQEAEVFSYRLDDGLIMNFVDEKHSLSSHDFSHQKLEVAKAKALDLMKKELEIPFNLKSEKPVKTVLFKVSKSTFYWFLKIHHIAIDGFGYSLLFQRFISIYNDIKESRDIPTFFGNLASLHLEEQEYLKSSIYQRDRNFWKNYLKEGVIEKQTQDLDFSHSTIKSKCFLDNKVLAQIEALADKLRVNWPSVLMASSAMEIHRRQGVRTVSIGIPMMNRIGSAAMTVPSMVMNIVPLTIRFYQNETYWDLTKRIHAEFMKIRRHAHFRYESMKNQFCKTDQRLFGPVVNIMPFSKNMELEGFTPISHRLQAGPVEDISFNFIVDSNIGSIELEIDANSKVYSPVEISTIAESVQIQILAIVNEDSDSYYRSGPIAYLPQRSTYHPSSNIADVLKENYSIHNESIAIEAGDKSLSYRELGEQVLKISSTLQFLSSPQKSPIAIALKDRLESIQCILACIDSGNSFVIIDCDGPQARNSKILETVSPAIVVTEENSSQDFCGKTKKLNFKELLTSQLRTTSKVPLKEDDEAYILFTSGSTGEPKGVQIPFRSLSCFVEQASREYRICSADRLLQFAPLNFDTSIEEIFCTLSLGASLILKSQSTLESIDAFIRDCKSKRISILDLPTAFFHELMISMEQKREILPSSVHTIIIGGEALDPERLKTWKECNKDGIRLINTYGPTEVTVVSTTAELCTGKNHIGKPLPHLGIAVVDEFRNPLNIGESGELLIFGDALASGYIKNKEATDKNFISWRPHSKPNEDLQKAYLTGDLVVLNKELNLEFCGRIDDEIKISGQRISPQEIEQVIGEHPNIKDSRIVASKDSGVCSIICFYRLAGQSPVPDNFKEYLRQHLPSVMIPRMFKQIQQWPLNRSGKIDQNALLATIDFKSAPAEEINELTALEAKIANVWEAVLGVKPNKGTDNFFLMGGQSLQTIQLASRLSDKLNFPFTVSDIFKYPNLEQMAALHNKDYQTENLKERIQQDACLELTDQEVEILSNLRQSSDIKCILLTGVTGYLGSQLLLEYIRESNARIHCLLRASTVEEGRERIYKTLRKFGPFTPKIRNEIEERVKIVLGDLGKESLGLPKFEYDNLCTDIDTIIHCGAVVSIVQNYDSLKPVNTESTRELIKIALRKTKKKLLYISTIAVCEGNQDGVAREIPQRFHSKLDDGYKQSKWVSERLIQASIEKGLTAQILRVGRISSSFRHPRVNSKDLVWKILSTSIRNQLFPLLPICEPWTPVDELAREIRLCLASLSPTSKSVIHVLPSEEVDLLDTIKWTRDQDHSFPIVPMDQWLEKVASSTNPEDQSLLAFFQGKKATSKKIRFDNSQFLESRGLCESPFTKLDEDKFRKYLDFAELP